MVAKDAARTFKAHLAGHNTYQGLSSPENIVIRGKAQPVCLTLHPGVGIVSGIS